MANFPSKHPSNRVQFILRQEASERTYPQPSHYDQDCNIDSKLLNSNARCVFRCEAKILPLGNRLFRHTEDERSEVS